MGRGWLARTSRSRRSRPVISTFPSSVNCLRRTFRSANKFEASPMKMVGFEAPFRCGGLRKQDLEDTPGNAHH
jgi:hypothetical protein